MLLEHTMVPDYGVNHHELLGFILLTAEWIIYNFDPKLTNQENPSLGVHKALVFEPKRLRKAFEFENAVSFAKRKTYPSNYCLG